jgi:spore coat protein U-like protein
VKLPLIACVVAAGVTAATAAHAMSCSVSASAVAFGSYDGLTGLALNSVGTITYRCDDVEPSDSIIIGLSRGNAPSYLPRTLQQGSYQLEYNLYLDALRTRIWGDGSSVTQQLGPFFPPNGVSTNVSVYGRIAGGQQAHGGSYSDTVVVTVVF